jgi:uncharacterized protein YfaT (DUF1175 family)
MVAALKVDPEQLWAAYQEAGSLRGAARITGVSHMIIRKHLLANGYCIDKPASNPQSMDSKIKVYCRPEQFEKLDELARKNGVRGRHEMARILLDQAISAIDPTWKGLEPNRKIHA